MIRTRQVRFYKPSRILSHKTGPVSWSFLLWPLGSIPAVFLLRNRGESSWWRFCWGTLAPCSSSGFLQQLQFYLFVCLLFIFGVVSHLVMEPVDLDPHGLGEELPPSVHLRLVQLHPGRLELLIREAHWHDGPRCSHRRQLTVRTTLPVVECTPSK